MANDTPKVGSFGGIFLPKLTKKLFAGLIDSAAVAIFAMSWCADELVPVSGVSNGFEDFP